MRYKLEQGISPMNENEEKKDVLLLEILTKEEYRKKYPDLVNNHLLLRSMENLNYCKVDIFKDYVIGTLRIPEKDDLIENEWTCGFYIDTQKLIFVGGVNKVKENIDKIAQNQRIIITKPADMLFEFFEMLVAEDVDFINKYEDDLESKEDEMVDDVNEIPKDFEQYIIKTRKELMVLNRYYRQMYALGRMLENCVGSIFDHEEKEMFHFFSDKVERFFADVQNLKEYALQIRDMYQSRIDVRQNKVIQFLTVVTTVFMPLTLITGWYGMNFSKMPELHYIYGYGIVILISLVIVLLEIYIFKKKKWI